jgi:CBS domain-containing protein
MQRDVLSVSPEASLLEVHRLFLEEEIHGAPVVDESGRLVGVLSSLDLLRAVRDAYDPDAAATSPHYFREELLFSGPDWQQLPEDFQDRMASLTAADAMVADVISVSPDTPVAEIAGLMRRQRIHRVVVVEDGAVIGLVSTFDLIGLIAGAGAFGGDQPATGR